ncbi:MAG: hypothetical protein HY712_06980 [candidate division NC10 bacterium]|nr:hypothetical protein [candidate division NC10 bacterium]
MGGARRGASGDQARLEALLAEAGLPMPPMPERAAARLKERAAWCFSTRAMKEPPENLMHYVRKAIGGASPDYVLVARTGPHASAWALHYYLVQGPLQLFLRIGWASALPEGERARDLARDCLDLAHDLVGTLPAAVRAGKLSRAGRLTVVATDIGEGFWEVSPVGGRVIQRRRASLGKRRNAPGPHEVLAQALRWCRGETFPASLRMGR